MAILPMHYVINICVTPPPPPPPQSEYPHARTLSIITDNNHRNNTGYSVSVMTHVITLKGGQSGLGELEPIASVVR